MKNLFIWMCLSFLFLSASSHSTSHSIPPSKDLRLEIKNQSLNKLLKPLWSSIPYRYDLSSFKLKKFNLDLNTSITSNTSISYKVRKGFIQLAEPTTPLVKIQQTETEAVKIYWNLNDALLNIDLKVRFKYRQFGIEITHDEVFSISANSIQNATSELSASYNQDVFSSRLSNFQNFTFQNIDIKPRDGVGSTLRYIFDNIFSEDDVDRYLKTAINTEIQKWLEDEALNNQINHAVTDLITNSSQQEVDLPSVGSSFKTKITKLSISGHSTLLQANINFTEKYFRHLCADLIPTADKQDIEISANTEIVETLINNLGINSVYENQKVREPLFCFGYKSYDEQGEPQGEPLKTRFLGKDINLDYWLKPLSLPKYTYNIQKQEVQIQIDVEAKLRTQKYPMIYTQKNPTLSLKLSFQLAMDDRGLILKYKTFLVHSIRGRIKVKWGKLTPKLTLPLKLVRRALNSSIRNQLGGYERILIPKEIPTDGNNFILLQEYKMYMEHKATRHSIFLNFDNGSEQ